MVNVEGRTIGKEVVEACGRGVATPLSDERFDRLARRVFAYQFRNNASYAAYCRRRERTPDTVEHWTRIPSVPTAAFKEVPLVCDDSDTVDAVFRTSGTTRGTERRGRHYVPDLSLYHAALLSSFSAYLLPDGAEVPILSLVPPVDQMVDSSLAHMISVVLDRLGSDRSGYYAAVGSGIDDVALARTLRGFEEAGTPVCLLGTTFSFVHWTDRLREQDRRFRLPAGSRLMDTGGTKGRSREVSADELRVIYGDRLGIPEDHVVNEYGMTELCSQFYDTVLRDRAAGADARPRHKQSPPWVRTVVVDPESLEPVPEGEVGILLHYDLANIGSVLAVQTEDIGRAVDDGFTVLGRAGGAPPRGCSIAMDLLLRAVEEERT